MRLCAVAVVIHLHSLVPESWPSLQYSFRRNGGDRSHVPKKFVRRLCPRDHACSDVGLHGTFATWHASTGQGGAVGSSRSLGSGGIHDQSLRQQNVDCLSPARRSCPRRRQVASSATKNRSVWGLCAGRNSRLLSAQSNVRR